MATHLSIDHGPDSWVTAHQYLEQGKAPLLAISSLDVHLVISAADRGALTDQDVKFARELVKAATAYLAGCEAVHAAHKAVANQEQHTGVHLSEVPA